MSTGDPWRLSFHLMPPQGWLNDPNGLCVFKDELHVFFQYSPDNPNGGQKYWGHYIGKSYTDFEVTKVYFRQLSDAELDSYIASTEPMDKAGAYGVQEWIGYVACTEMKGSYFNVMGFPVHLVYQALKKRGF